MALCIIHVEKFEFPVPKILWTGSSSYTEYTYGDTKTISVVTNYSEDYSIELQKFNEIDWVTISNNLSIEYDKAGTDRYRIKVIKGDRYKFSNELILVKNKSIKIAIDEDKGHNPIYIKFLQDLDQNIKSYTLVHSSQDTILRYDNSLTFVPKPSLNKVYLEVLYYDGSRVNTNTVTYNFVNEFNIYWQNNTKEDRQGYDSNINVVSDVENVTWQIAGEDLRFTLAAFFEGRIILNEGINNIRGYLHSDIYSNNILKYNLLPKGKLFIRWNTGGSLERVVNEGAENNIVIDNQYPQDNIISKKIKIWTDGVLEELDYDNTLFVQKGNVMSFQVEITYDNGLLLQSNILTSKTIILPKITWSDDTKEDRRGSDSSVVIKKYGLVVGNEYKLQIKKSGDTEEWIDVVGDNISFDEFSEYYIRLIDTGNVLLVSNILKYHRVDMAASGNLKWKDTDEQIVNDPNIKIVVNVNQDALGSYKLVANKVLKGFVDNIRPSKPLSNRNAGMFLSAENESPVSRLEANSAQENTTVVLKENVTSGEYDLSDSLRFGLYYIKLQHVEDGGSTSDVGNVVINRIINNTLQIEDSNYYDDWGIKKERPTHRISFLEIKSHITNNVTGKFIFRGLETPDPEGHTRETKIQRKVGVDGAWVDDTTLDTMYFSKNKSSHLEYFRVKTVLNNNVEIFSNEIRVVYVGEMLKVDGDKYIITDNISNLNSSGRYNDTENAHELTPSLYNEFKYQYQIASNSTNFVDAGDVFTYSAPLGISGAFYAGYINGINVVRVKVLDKDNNAILGYSNCVWCMFSALDFKWKENERYELQGIKAYGLGMYEGVVENLTSYHLGTGGSVEIFKGTNETNIRTIINGNDRVFNYNGEFNNTLEFGIEDTSLAFNDEYIYVLRWENYLGFSFVHDTKLYSTKIENRLMERFGHNTERMYEIKEDNPNAYDIYYNYQHTVLYLDNGSTDENRFRYVLQRADIGGDSFQDTEYTGTTYNYILPEGDYRVKIVVDNIYTFYTNTVTYYNYTNLLSVNNKKSFFGLLNLVEGKNKIHNPEYNINLDIRRFGREYTFQLQASNNSRDLLAGDSITTRDNKKYISDNSLVDVGQPFHSRNLEVPRIVFSQKYPGLARFRLKVFKNGEIVGYSNILYIFLDTSTFYFIDHTRGSDRVSFPRKVDGSDVRYHTTINSILFCIKFEHTYPTNSSELYYHMWNGSEGQDKYSRRLSTLDADRTYVNINRDKGIYRYYRKLRITEFNIWIDLDDHVLEQVVFTMSMAIHHRFLRKEYRMRGLHLFIDESSISIIEGGFKKVTLNTGSYDYNFEIKMVRKFYYWQDEEDVEDLALLTTSNRDGSGNRVYTYTANKHVRGRTKFKARLIYNGYIALETNEVQELHFFNALSLDRNRTGNDAIRFRNNISDTRIVMYANNVVGGYNYQMQYKELLVTDNDGYGVDDNYWDNKGNQFTSNDRITITYNSSDRKIGVGRLKIFDGNTHIGYSTVVLYKKV